MQNKAQTILNVTSIVVIALLVMAALLYFVPWPTRIDQQMIGAELSADGNVLEECAITAKGWRLDYLFQEDNVNLGVFQMAAPENYNLLYKDQLQIPLQNSVQCVELSWAWFSEANTSQYQTAIMYMSPDCSWMMIILNNRYFAVSVEGGLTPEEIWDTVTADVNFK